MAKASKSQARYQDHPKGNDCCKDCTMFRSPQSCTAVEGAVKPSGWCSYFDKAEQSGKSPAGWRNKLGE